MVGASPANSALLQDEPTVKVFNEMNFEYGALGNHEFDEGLGEFNRIMKGEAPTPGQFNKIVDEYPHEASKQEVVNCQLGRQGYQQNPIWLETLYHQRNPSQRQDR